MVKMDEKNSLSTPKKKDYKDKHAIEAPKSNVSNEKSKEKTFGNFSYTHSLTQDIIPVYQMFIQKDFLGLKERLHDMDYYFVGHTFNSYFEFQECLIRDTRINMVEVLEIPSVDDTNLVDIINNIDKTKTATVFRSDTKGIEYFHTDKDRHFVDVVGELIGEKQLETCKLLAQLFKVNILEHDNVVDIRNGVEYMLSVLRSENLSTYMPNFHKIFKNYIDVTCCLLETISKQDVLYDPESKEYKVYSYLSLNSYCLIYEKEYTGYSMSKVTMNKNVATAVIVGLLNKVHIENAPKEIRNSLYGYKVSNQYKYHTHILTLPLFTKDYMKQIESKAKHLVDNNFKRQDIDKNTLLINYGLDVATEAYVQLAESEKKVSKNLLNLYSDAEKIISKQIIKSDYISVPKLVDRLYINKRKVNKLINKSDIESDLNKISNVLCKELGLNRVGLTKKIRSDLKISDKDIRSNKRPQIYIKNKGT